MTYDEKERERERYSYIARDRSGFFPPLMAQGKICNGSERDRETKGKLLKFYAAYVKSKNGK